MKSADKSPGARGTEFSRLQLYRLAAEWLESRKLVLDEGGKEAYSPGVMLPGVRLLVRRTAGVSFPVMHHV